MFNRRVGTLADTVTQVGLCLGNMRSFSVIHRSALTRPTFMSKDELHGFSVILTGPPCSVGA